MSKQLPKKQLGDGSALQRKYSPSQLADIFAFCQHDFERFLELLVWLEEL